LITVTGRVSIHEELLGTGKYKEAIKAVRRKPGNINKRKVKNHRAPIVK